MANPRSVSGTVAPPRQNTNGGPEIWGKWAGAFHYSLDVVQHPLRARMCGFGDKDRRPLAPAAVVRMIVRREGGSFVDPNEVDCSFFLVTADLWSADGKQQANLVQHPSSAERNAQPYPAKQKRRTSGPSSCSAQQPQESNTNSTPAPIQYRPSTEVQTSPTVAPIAPSQPHGYAHPSYPFPTPQDPMGFQPPQSYPHPDTSPNWTYPTDPDRSSYPPQALPSIQSFARQAGPSNLNGPTPPSDSWAPGTSIRVEPEQTYRAWPVTHSYHTLGSASFPTNQGSDHPFRNIPPAPQPSTESSTWSQGASSPTTGPSSQGQPQYCPISPSYGSPVYDPAVQTQHQPQCYPESHATNHDTPDTPVSNIPPSPRHTFTRTLVGPLSANACYLKDEHQMPGIFFLFQDLSVRTEGAFRLRLRLLNIGAPPAPGPGASRIHTDVSHVLAQTFTDTFIVYSAKKFPGVPETTPLSIALNDQGQKLPLRNRRGSRKGLRKRERDDSFDEESD